MSTGTDYGMRVETKDTVPQARQRIETALKSQGFGILTEIDVKATLKNKIDVDFDDYLILGACNPSLAHQGLQSERELGLMLPCNVIIYRDEQRGATVVSIFDPRVGMTLAGNPELEDLAEVARGKLEAALQEFQSP